MKPVLIIIAGPMVSGKTTAAKILVRIFKNTVYHKEINQYTLRGGSHLGGAFVDQKLEEEIVEADLSRLKKIVGEDKGLIHLIETDIFHCVYTKLIEGEEKAERFKKEYRKLHQKAKVGALFLDTKPQISWARRRGYYLKRTLAEIKRQGLRGVEAKKLQDKTMRKYKERIFTLYPFWLEMFETLPFPKIKIPNNGKSLEIFRKKVIDGFLKLTKKMKVPVEAKPWQQPR